MDILLFCLIIVFRPEEGGKSQRNLKKDDENKKDMAEVVNAWNVMRWLTPDRPEWQKHVCTYASDVAESEGVGVIMM